MLLAAWYHTDSRLNIAALAHGKRELSILPSRVVAANMNVKQLIANLCRGDQCLESGSESDHINAKSSTPTGTGLRLSYMSILPYHYTNAFGMSSSPSWKWRETVCKKKTCSACECSRNGATVCNGLDNTVCGGIRLDRCSWHPILSVFIVVIVTVLVRYMWCRRLLDRGIDSKIILGNTNLPAAYLLVKGGGKHPITDHVADTESVCRLCYIPWSY